MTRPMVLAHRRDRSGSSPGAPTPLPPGTVLGSYAVERVLGEGGMGYVYLGEHTRLGRRVALKVLHPHCAAQPANVKRFFGEACAVNRISHQHIIEITDFVDEGAQPYYIMELLQGRTLQAEIQASGGFEAARAIHVALQITSALGAVHEAGIIHRDLKPANIFLTERNGRRDFVKLLDFGVAKLTDTTSGRSLGETMVGMLLGTPMYMSPEQAAGRKDLDHRTDIYSLGVILYEMVTGLRPFRSENCTEVLVQHMSQTPVAPSRLCARPIPAELEALILACLAKDADERPATMVDVARRLREIKTELGKRAHSSAETELRAKAIPASRSPWVGATKLLLAIFAALSIVFLGALLGRELQESYRGWTFQMEVSPLGIPAIEAVPDPEPHPAIFVTNESRSRSVP